MPVADVQNLVFSSLLWLFRSTVPAGWSLQIRPGRFWKWLERASLFSLARLELTYRTMRWYGTVYRNEHISTAFTL